MYKILYILFKTYKMDSNNDDSHMKQFNIDYTKDMEKEEEFEILKLKDPNVHVFELPPM